MFFNLSSHLEDVTLAYVGLTVLPDMAAALSRDAVAAVESILPDLHSYNNPENLGKHIDIRV